MQVEEHDGKVVQRIVTALIVSTEVLCRLAPRWTPDPFAAKWANLAAEWSVQHYKKHGQAPKSMIVSWFEQWSHTNVDPDTKKAMERFLTALSSKYESLLEDTQPAHIIELATTHFNDVRLERVFEDAQNRMRRGDSLGAIEVVEGFRKVQLSAPKYIDVFRDTEAQKLALQRQHNVCIRYEGGIGEFFGSELSEDSFIAFLAPPKSGKSFMMQDLAWTAMRQKKKVAYFQVGDMTQDQIMRRLQKRAARRPLKRGVVPWPISLVPTEGGIAQVEHEDRIYDNDMTVEEGVAAYQKIVAKHKTQRLRLSCHPSKSICANDIRSILEEWDREGWHADVVICDYMDNLAPNNHKMTDLAQVEDSWTSMRQISEVRKCLVVTATQVNAEGFNVWVMTKRNFSRNKMIMAIVTAFFGINQTDEERAKSLFRLNALVCRDSKFSESRCCYVASCLGIAQSVVLSAFP